MVGGRTVVLGLGNTLLGDEGVGVHAADILAADPTFCGCALAVGTAVLDALPALETADKVVVVDAMRGGNPPGTVYRTTLENITARPVIGSVHGFDITRVLALARRHEAPDVVVIGVEPESIDWSLELSPVVADAMPAILDAVQEETHSTRSIS